MKVQTRRTRPGFTLIELLVVIGIIAVLMGISVVVVTGVMRGQTGAGSAATISKAASELDRQWKAVKDNVQDEWRAGKGAAVATVKAAFPGDEDTARRVFLRLRLAQEFPQNFAEARTGPQYVVPGSPPQTLTLPGKPSYNTALSGVTGGTGEEQSAVCLVMAVNESRRGTVSNLEEAVGPSTLRPFSGTQARLLVDLWGQPIAFRRHETGKNNIDWKWEIYSSGPDKAFNTGDDLTSLSLRQVGARGDQ